MHFGIRTPSLLIPAMACAALCGTSAQAQIRLNYDNLNSLEEPLAFEIGAATVLVNGVVDVPVDFAIDTDDVLASDTDVSINGNMSVNIEAQLGNRWNVGATYFGQYDERTREYNDNVAGYIRTSWGSVVGGNVNGLVRESTRRRRGVGNAVLAYDDFYGRLGRWGGGYSGRFGPTVISGVVDQDGNFELGTEFQRPIGNKDYRFTTRANKASFTSADGTAEFDTYGIASVGELVYGSGLLDLGAGYERIENGALKLDRWYVSSGGQIKLGSLSLSAAGHYGELDGSSEHSAAFGMGYDIARGLSTNLGVNTRRAEVARDGISIVDDDETSATASVRYSF